MRVTNERGDDRDTSNYEPILDMSVEEYQLGDVIPGFWVDDNGIKHLIVWDEGVELRYLWENGKLKILKAEIF